MSKRVDALKQKIAANIANQSSGFKESIPSIRDLIARFDESHHVVNAALKGLVDEGVLSSAAGKGFFVRNTAILEDDICREVDVVIMENTLWQIDFWCVAIKMFGDAHPQFRVSPRFLWSDEEVLEYFRDNNTGNASVILSITEPLEKSLRLVPPPELERMLGAPLCPEPLLPGLESQLQSFCIPFQLQPTQFFYNLEYKPIGYNWRKGLFHFLECVAATPDCREKLHPLGMPFMFSAAGFNESADFDSENTLPRLREFRRCFRYIHDHRLFNMNVPNGPFSEMRELAALRSNWAARASFVAGSIDLSQKKSQFGVLPIPIEPGIHFQIPCCRAAVVGNRSTPGCAELIRFILSRPIQEMMMKRAIGYSPVERYLRQAADEPKKYPVDLSEVAQFILEQAPLTTQHTGYEDDFFYHEVTDRLAMPILSGGDVSDLELEQLAADLREKASALPQGNRLKMLRQRLLNKE